MGIGHLAQAIQASDQIGKAATETAARYLGDRDFCACTQRRIDQIFALIIGDETHTITPLNKATRRGQ